ncbi:hypothetical protein EBZ39_02075 [bacterium]|nr:hypothetical protein [bacterium]
MSNYAQISSNTLIKNQAGKIKGIMVSAASSTPTITIYDQQTPATSLKVIDTFTPVAATNYNFYDGINTEFGIYVVIGGTVSCTIYFE